MIFPLLFACSEHDLKSLSDDIDTPIEDGDAINFEPTEEPNIYVDPPLADFGGVMKDCPSDWMNINIQNRGLEDLVISSMDLLGEDFALEAFDENTSEFFQNGTIVLPYAQSIDVQIRLTPDYFIDYDATLQIHSNDPDESVVDVLATGKGTAGPQFEESFVQNFHEKVDLLWVIDNSPSMEDNIWHVQQNFQSFLGSFLSLGLDFQMAITTTDPDLRGRFQGSPEILTSDMAQSIISTTFIDTLTGLGTEGAFWEEGLQVTKYALENTMQKNLFLRGDDAALSVIIVSDEDDNGSALQGQQFIDWFQGLKSDPSKVQMHGFLNQSLDDGTSEGNPIYDEIIAATSGHTVDIEATSYLTALAEIGYAAAGMIVSYTLDQQPYPSNSISVTTGDGSIVHKDNSNGWSYNESTNVLTFHGDAIPELGETVIITYEVEGTCQNDSE